jgi:4-amino-4-deoxy-L-arabinose transferase-like glycosyltransferase
VLRALQLGSGSFNLQRVGKGGFYFVLFFEYGLYFVLMKLSGAVSSAADFAREYVRDPSPFYLMGRATAALCGTFTVLLVHRIARRVTSDGSGLVAALFLAVCTLHVDLSHRIGVDVPMTLAVSAVLLFALRIADKGRRSDYLVAAALAAIATTTKLPGILTLIPLFIAHVLNMRRHQADIRGIFASKSIWLAAGIFLLILVVTNPGVFVYANPIGLFMAPEAPIGDLDDDLIPVATPNLWLFYLSVIRDALGWPLAILAAAAIVHSCLKRGANFSITLAMPCR